MSVCLNTINTKLSISQDLSKSQMKKKKERKGDVDVDGQLLKTDIMF